MLSLTIQADVNCRHAAYQLRNEVYRSDFENDQDYRLALALTNHLDAAAITLTRGNNPRVVFSGRVSSWQPLRKHIQRWSTLPWSVKEALSYLSLVFIDAMCGDRKSDQLTRKHSVGHLVEGELYTLG